jgi:hypothetical protein
MIAMIAIRNPSISDILSGDGSMHLRHCGLSVIGKRMTTQKCKNKNHIVLS